MLVTREEGYSALHEIMEFLNEMPGGLMFTERENLCKRSGAAGKEGGAEDASERMEEDGRGGVEGHRCCP